MAIHITTEVVCNECWQSDDGISAHKSKTREARLKAKHEGWIVGRNENGCLIDLCPACKLKLIKEN